jgi:hypothetical protein
MLVWYNGIQCPVRRQDGHLSAQLREDMERRRRKACLGLNCSVNSLTHPLVHFKKCLPCSQQLGINSDYCSKACQETDWSARHKRFHGLMLFSSGEVNPAEGYPRPDKYMGSAIPTGYMHDWTHAIYIKERMKMLEDSIQRVLTEHEVKADQVLLQVLHSACYLQQAQVWTAPTGNALQPVGFGDGNDQATMRENLCLPLRRCIRRLLHVIYEDAQFVAYNSRSIQLQDGGFHCDLLHLNQWQAVLTFVTGQPNDEMKVIIQGRDNGGEFIVQFHHSREWRLFRYRNP